MYQTIKYNFCLHANVFLYIFLSDVNNPKIGKKKKQSKGTSKACECNREQTNVSSYTTTLSPNAHLIKSSVPFCLDYDSESTNSCSKNKEKNRRCCQVTRKRKRM